MTDVQISYLTGTSPVPSLDELGLRLNAPPDDGPPDVIPGLLPRQGELVIAGETNVGKSLLALEIASCLSTGNPLWGQLEPKLKARKILYILGEHYAAVIQRLLQVTRLPMADTAYILGPEQLGYDKWVVSQGKPNLVGIEKFKKWADGCDLIVWDPLSSFLTGVDAENDNLVMRLTLDTMSLVAQSVGASCLVLAHQGKPMMDHQGKEQRRKTYAIRGASAVEDAATNIFYFSAAQSAASKEANQGKTFELVMRKYKGIAPAIHNLYRDPVTLTHTLLGDSSNFADVRKIDIRGKLARLQERNPAISYTTAIDLVAAFEGVAPDTIKRWLGIEVQRQTAG